MSDKTPRNTVKFIYAQVLASELKLTMPEPRTAQSVYQLLTDYGCTWHSKAKEWREPEEGTVRDTGWIYRCQNCDSLAFDQECYVHGVGWVDFGVQCRVCWRTYTSEFDYTY